MLREAHALPIVFPELAALFGVRSPRNGIRRSIPVFTPDGARPGSAPEQRSIGASPLSHTTWARERRHPPSGPDHVAHEQRSVELIETMCRRLRIPNSYREVAVLVGRYRLLAHTLLELRAKTLLELLEHLARLPSPARLEQFMLACEADARGRKGLETRLPAGAGTAACTGSGGGGIALRNRPRRTRRYGIAARLRTMRIAALGQMEKS